MKISLCCFMSCENVLFTMVWNYHGKTTNVQDGKDSLKSLLFHWDKLNKIKLFAFLRTVDTIMKQGSFKPEIFLLWRNWSKDHITCGVCRPKRTSELCWTCVDSQVCVVDSFSVLWVLPVSLVFSTRCNHSHNWTDLMLVGHNVGSPSANQTHFLLNPM